MYKVRWNTPMEDFSFLKGKTLVSLEQSTDNEEENDSLVFKTTDGETFILIHVQDCCESVYLEDICGDLEDLVGTPILLAEEVSNFEEPYNPYKEDWGGTYTWTFYKLSTIKGSVTLRWLGTSNGYYSESVGFYKI